MFLSALALCSLHALAYICLNMLLCIVYILNGLLFTSIHNYKIKYEGKEEESMI